MTMSSSVGFLQKKLIFITGKGGVGKSTIAKQVAQQLASEGRKTLLVEVLSIVEKKQEIVKESANLWCISLNPSDSFGEYIQLKLKIKALYMTFLNSKITQYLEKAAPGIKELVLLGKIWFERENYDHIVVDMPSSGYTLTMLHTPFNFANLFPGGPVFQDCRDMIKTFSDPEQAAFVVVTLAEDMPLQESLDLAAEIHSLMPENRCWLVVNRMLKLEEKTLKLAAQSSKDSPYSKGIRYLVGREKKQKELLESFNNSETQKHFHGGWTNNENIYYERRI